jgi:hypothetical protein
LTITPTARRVAAGRRQRLLPVVVAELLREGGQLLRALDDAIREQVRTATHVDLL